MLEFLSEEESHKMYKNSKMEKKEIRDPIEDTTFQEVKRSG